MEKLDFTGNNKMEEKTNEKIHILKFDFIGLPGNKQPKNTRELLGFQTKKSCFQASCGRFPMAGGHERCVQRESNGKKMWERGWKRKSGTRYQQTGKPVEPLLFDSRLEREKDY